MCVRNQVGIFGLYLTHISHFSHKNILNFRDSATSELIRPGFTDVNHMNEHMIDRWNSVVKPGDKVYHLGDVFFGDKDAFKKLWPKLHGSKRLIVGNHDDIPFLSSGGFFQKVQMWRHFTQFGLMLSHVPLHVSSLLRHQPARQGEDQQEPNMLVNVHGHTHTNGSPDGPYISVCVELRNYTPVHIEDLMQEAKALTSETV